jgi:hypothetical protein
MTTFNLAYFLILATETKVNEKFRMMCGQYSRLVFVLIGGDA